MGWHGLPSPGGLSRVSDGVKMAMAVFGAAIMMIIVVVLAVVLVVAVVDVLFGTAGGCKYRKHGPVWRRGNRAVPARDRGGRGMLTVREQQLWDDLVARYDTDAAADPWRREGA